MAVVMITILSKQSMRMRISTMQNSIHQHIDDQPCSRSNKHNGRILHKLMIEDTQSSLIYNEDNQYPYNE